ncbi:RNA-directed DNA polymerase, eukaryota, reverse transcriptase zinc-binding domain protein [Tanacetum coccineum]
MLRVRIRSGENPSDYLDGFESFTSRYDKGVKEKSQLDKYLEEPPLDRFKHPDLNILQYWKENQGRYPELALMARDILSIPITTVLLCTRDWLFDQDGEARQILDGVIVANETMTYLKQQKEKSLIFKVFFEKAYDSINWRFLLNIMERMVFGNKWCKRIEACLKLSSTSILVNGSPTEEFEVERGVRQGDPLAPFLFILAAEGLNVIMSEAVETNIFRGVKVGSDLVTVSHLQYADDTIFSENGTKRMLGPLCVFLSVLKRYRDYRKKFFWGGNEEGKKLSWVKWDLNLASFEDGGLSVGSLRAKNLALLGKWIFTWGGEVTKAGRGVWTDIMKFGVEIDRVGVDFTSSCLGVLGDGRDIRFWEDRWVRNRILRDRFPRLYHMDSRKEGSVLDKGDWVNNGWT